MHIDPTHHLRHEERGIRWAYGLVSPLSMTSGTSFFLIFPSKQPTPQFQAPPPHINHTLPPIKFKHLTLFSISISNKIIQLEYIRGSKDVADSNHQIQKIGWCFGTCGVERARRNKKPRGLGRILERRR